jgi:hypothetical protein
LVSSGLGSLLEWKWNSFWTLTENPGSEFLFREIIRLNAFLKS